MKIFVFRDLKCKKGHSQKVSETELTPQETRGGDRVKDKNLRRIKYY